MLESKDLPAIKAILKGVLTAAKSRYPQAKVAIVSPHGHSGVYCLEDFSDHHVTVKDANGSVLLFPIAYVDYVIGLDTSSLQPSE